MDHSSHRHGHSDIELMQSPMYLPVQQSATTPSIAQTVKPVTATIAGISLHAALDGLLLGATSSALASDTDGGHAASVAALGISLAIHKVCFAWVPSLRVVDSGGCCLYGRFTGRWPVPSMGAKCCLG
jgi:hypothetical protein